MLREAPEQSEPLLQPQPDPELMSLVRQAFQSQAGKPPIEKNADPDNPV